MIVNPPISILPLVHGVPKNDIGMGVFWGFFHSLAKLLERIEFYQFIENTIMYHVHTSPVDWSRWAYLALWCSTYQSSQVVPQPQKVKNSWRLASALVLIVLRLTSISPLRLFPFCYCGCDCRPMSSALWKFKILCTACVYLYLHFRVRWYSSVNVEVW